MGVGVDIDDVIRAHQRGELDAAEAGYRAFLDADPRHVRALQMSALLARQRDRHGEARDAFARVVGIEPTFPDHWTNLGGARRAAGEPESAAVAYGRALALDPAHEATAFNLANLLGADLPGTAQDGVMAAAAWYGRVLALNPDHKAATNNLDLLQAAHPARFEAAARRALALSPAGAHALTDMARAALRRSGLLGWSPGKVRELHLEFALTALDLLARVAVVETGPADASADGEEERLRLALAIDLLQLGALDDDRLTAAARVAWKRLRVAPRDIQAGTVIGYHAYRRGRLPLASRLQRRFLSRFTAEEIAADGELGYWSMLRADPPFFAALPSMEEVLARLPPMEVLARPAEGATPGEPVIMVSGDETYVARFGPALLESLARHAPGAGVVINMVVPADNRRPSRGPGLVAEWRRRLPLSIGFSLDRPRMADWPRARQTSYFAAARFIRAFQWHRSLGRPLIVVDLDASARTDLRRLSADMAGYDLGLLWDGRRRGPFREITVCYNYYNATPAAARYLELVAAYIGHFLLDGEARWLLDQSAHLAVLQHLRDIGEEPKVRWYDFPTFPHCSFIGEK